MDMQQINKAFWIWCEFSCMDTDYLMKIQDNVQNKLRGPKFKLHMTLAGPFVEISKSSIEEMKSHCIQQSSIKAKILCYEYKELFFQSFYIAICQSKELEKLRAFMFKINQQTQTKYFYPHISLAYGNHQKNIKKALIKTLPPLKDSITVNKISIVQIEENINNWEISNSFSFMSGIII